MTPALQHETREAWLMSATALLAAEFFPILDTKEKLPVKMACSCGFPWKQPKAIGQCFSAESAADGTVHMFVCPTQDDPVRVLDILLHEMGHAALGIEEAHGKRFKAFCREVGLSGKATATVAEVGTALHAKLSAIAEQLGVYPHTALVKTQKAKKKAAAGGWVRMMSATEEDYKITISPKQLEKNGPPLDPWGEKMVRVDGDEDE